MSKKKIRFLPPTKEMMDRCNKPVYYYINNRKLSEPLPPCIIGECIKKYYENYLINYYNNLN